MTSLYEQILTFQVELNQQPLQVISKPGLPNWNRVTPVQTLLAEHVLLQGNEQVLLLGCDHGVLAASLASQLSSGTLTCSDDNLVALQMTAKTLQANKLPLGNLVSPLELNGPYDIVVIRQPKGRKLARRWLLEAYALLSHGGTCYLGGANREGIQSVLKDSAALFDAVSILGYRKGCRVGRMSAPQDTAAIPKWASMPGLAPNSWYEFDVMVNEFTFKLRSLPGVFSFGRLDRGTQFLLDIFRHQPMPSDACVLDFACGSGIIGMVAARRGASQVDLLDVNLLAIAAAKENLHLNQIGNGCVLASDLFQAVQGKVYDQIITNPPFHAGYAVDTDITQSFLAQVRAYLKPGGQLILVANRFLRYDLFGSVEILAATGKYHIIKVT